MLAPGPGHAAIGPWGIPPPLRHNAGMQIIDFRLDRDHVALNDLLHLAGIAGTGGMGKAIVAAGDVFVDGVQELRKTAKIRAGQVVRVDDVEIRVVD
jgi:ribosome-associated protein